MAKIGLGTVQFGIPYGNQKNSALMGFEEVRSIVVTALEKGVRYFDTAAAYGESESRLGQISELQTHKAEIVTKIPRAPDDVWRAPQKYIEFVLASSKSSLSKLKKSKFSTLFFHQCEVEFLESSSFKLGCDVLVNEGICSHVGVSVYKPIEAECASSLKFVSALQVPVNLIDTRFVSGDLFQKIRASNISLVARSMFLQGALIPNAKLPPVRRRTELENLRARAVNITSNCNVDLQKLCFALIFQHLKEKVDVALLGVDSLASLQQNLEYASCNYGSDYSNAIGMFQKLEQEASENGLNNPSQWDLPS